MRAIPLCADCASTETVRIHSVVYEISDFPVRAEKHRSVGSELQRHSLLWFRPHSEGMSILEKFIPRISPRSVAGSSGLTMTMALSSGSPADSTTFASVRRTAAA